LGLASLRFRLLLLVMVAVLPSIGLLLAAARESERRAEVALRGDAERLAHLLAEDQKRSIESAEGLLTGAARIASLAYPIDPARCQAALADIRAQIPGFNNLSVVNPSGDILCAAVPRAHPVNIADHVQFRRAVATRAFSSGEYHIGRITGRPSFHFGAPVIGPSGRLEAVLTAGLDLGAMQQRLDGHSVPEGAVAVVTDAAGVVLARQPPPVRGGERFDSPLVSAMLQGTSGEAEHRDPDGVERLYVYQPVMGPGDRPAMLVAVGLPTELARAQVRGLFVQTMAGFGGVALLAIALALFMGERLLALPLDRIIAAARRLSRGDLAARTGVSRGRGEIGELAATFDEMARSLEKDAGARSRLEEQLRHAQKMEAVGQLAGGIAHDFNNLLTAILSFARFVRHDLGEAHPSRPDVDEILASAERAATLTRQLLAFSRRQVLEPRVLDLGETVRGVEKMLRRLIGEDVVLETRIAPGTGAVLADPGHVEQVILNLAVNARDAMPGGGRLVIEVADADASAAAGEGELPPGPLVRLSLHDTGVGIDEATLTRIFEPFFTTKPAGKGTGLGLSTVYGIVIQSGGAIRVKSAPGEGSTFSIYLPRADERPAPAAPSTEPRERRHKAETVLLVEDDASVRALARRALAQAGYEVLEAARPSEARAIAEQSTRRIHLLLTDVILPEQSGRELARELLELRPGLRVLYTSGYTAGHLADDDVTASGHAFLPKPFTPEQLLERVRDVLDGPPPAPRPPPRREPKVGAVS
jgi:signal transduction histidine kinase/CheY-like chemotaxis protein